MNKRQAKKKIRKHIGLFPSGRRSKAGIWLKKEARKSHAELLESCK